MNPSKLRFQQKVRWIIAFICIVVGLFSLTWATAQKPSLQKKSALKTAALLEVDGAIGPAVQDFIRRGVRRAIMEGSQVIILQIDTPGGLSKSMRGIIKTILASPVPIISYVAPSGARAASAGTYILYASHIAAMAPGTNLGAATPVSMGSPGAGKDKKPEKQKSASELKAINDAKAYIRSLAQLRGRNVKWAEEAVSKGSSLSAAEALKRNVINFVAKDIPDLLAQANGKTVMVLGQAKKLETANLTINRVTPGWRSKFLAVMTTPSVAYILLMIGFYGLFFEFASPGFILPGVAGAISLLLALYAFQLLPISYAGLGLILLGMAFIVAEVFMPSFGVLGIGGIISFVVGSIMLLRVDAAAFHLPWKLIIAVTVITGLFFLMMLQLVLRSRRSKVVSGREGMLGKKGLVVRREGALWVKVEGELWGLADSEQFSDGDRVEVVQIEGLTLTVKK